MDRLPVCGLVLAGLSFLLTSGCGGGSDPEMVTARNSRYEVAEDGSAAPSSKAARAPAAASGTGSSKNTPAATRSPDAAVAKSATTPNKPSSTPPASVEGLSNSPAEMMAQITELQKRQPVGGSREEALADFQQTQETIIDTSDKVLAGEAPESTLISAAQAKMSSLNALAQLGDPNARERLIAFCKQLQEHENERLQDVGRRVGFATLLDAFVGGASQDPEPMLNSFQELIKHEAKDEQLISLGRQISSALEQGGHSDAAETVLAMLLESFGEEVEGEELKAAVVALREESDIISSDARTKFVAAAQGDEAAEKEFLATADELLASDRRGVSTVSFLLQQAAFTLEAMKPELADELYARIGAAFAEHPNAELADFVKKTIERYEKRSGLIGQPFVVEGVKLNGDPLDWSQYQGKVVLVDFWATWCVPCLREFPNIKKVYEQYKDQGFEVVGVNLDDDPQDVQAFFSVQELPWPTVVSSDPNQRGMQTPLAVDAGVEFIPFIVLVGRDGKVAALNVRGEELGPKVKELLEAPAAP